MIDDILQNIERYLSLKRFTGDKAFNANLQSVQDWQNLRMADTYKVLLKNESHADLLQFFLNDIYGGIELEHLKPKLNRTVKLIDKLFSDLELVHLTFEFNALTGELDEAITIQLFDKMGILEITEENYSAAFRALDNFPEREHQLNLIHNFVAESKGIINDQLVYSAFKLAQYPAKIGGLGSLHQMIARGFQAMRIQSDQLDIIDKILQHEIQIYQAINQGNSDPFIRYAE